MRCSLLLGCLLVAACGENPVQPEPDPELPEILMTSSRADGLRHIFAISRDGATVVRLTHPPGVALAGRWSPDGRRIVFVREMDAFAGGEGRIVGQIFVMNADGSNPVRLSNEPMYDDYPDWSPDGSRIVFSRHWGSDYGIHVMDANGSNLARLTTGGMDFQPRWSPDGERIGFLSSRGGPSTWGGRIRIHVMDRDGSNITPLPVPEDVIRDVTSFAWSPDRSKIAFGYDDSIYLMNAVGAPGFTRLADPQDRFDGTPVWSPDGQFIAFTTGREHPGGGSNVFIVNADGTQLQNLTRNEGFTNVVTSWR
jgi:Tol biopolymer transport system component